MDAITDHVLPTAVVTGRDGGARLVDVDEVEGVLLERATGAEIDLVDLVMVFGLPELERSAA